MYLAYLLTFSLAFPGILSDISSEVLCGQGPAGTTLTLGMLFGSAGEDLMSLQLRSGRDHSDPGLASQVRRDHCDLALAVEARQGPLQSQACS